MIDYVQHFILDAEPDYTGDGAMEYHNSIMNNGRWRHYRSDKHPNVYDLANRFMGEHARLPSIMKGETVQHYQPGATYAYDIEKRSVRGGAFVNGAIFAVVDEDDGYSMTLLVDNDVANIHSYPNVKYTLNGKYYSGLK